jgi:hypothetical protein
MATRRTSTRRTNLYLCYLRSGPEGQTMEEASRLLSLSIDEVEAFTRDLFECGEILKVGEDDEGRDRWRPA